MKKHFITLLSLLFLLQCTNYKNERYNETLLQIPLREKITFKQYVDTLIKNNNFKKYPDINDIK